MISKFLLCAPIFLFMTFPALAAERPLPAPKPLEARAEVNWRHSNDRSILMSEFWVPIAQNESDGSVIYGDLRMMGDNNDNNEFNVGVGYREMVENTLLGEGIAGAHIWFDRRLTKRGSKFNQVTAGMEWFGEVWDAKLNAYMPLNKDKSYTQTNPNGSGAGFVGNQIVVNTDQSVVEEALPGLDLELGWKVPFLDDFTDSTRIYVGGYHFEGDRADDVTGWRTRIASDITSDISLGARFQQDDERGSQTFVEATIRFPFGNKQSFKENGLRARLDESPERDIDIVSSEAVTDDGVNEILMNATTGTIQNVIHVDNTNGAGTGTAENPFNTLAAAEAAAGTNDIIYVHRGDGTTAGQANGITINDVGQMLIGSGANLTYDRGRFATSNGNNISGSAATLISSDPLGAPVFTNGAGDGVTVTADGSFLSGFTVDSATNNGINASYSAGAQINNIEITNVSASNNVGSGILISASDAGTLLDIANVRNVTADNNGQLGVAIFSQNNATINTATTSYLDLDTNGNQGLGFLANTGGTIENAYARKITAQNNVFQGVAVQADNSSTVEYFLLQDSTLNNNANQGFIIFLDNSSNVVNAVINNNIMNNNTLSGMFLSADNFSSLNALAQNNSTVSNGNVGVLINDDTTNAFTFDLGGGALGSLGNNSIFSNTTADLFIDMDGATLEAQNNWWGSTTGLNAGNVIFDSGSSINASGFLTNDPNL